MDISLLAALHAEERTILDDLRSSLPFRRLEEIRQLLCLYAEQPPVGAALDSLLGDAAPRSRAAGPPRPAVIALHAERATA